MAEHPHAQLVRTGYEAFSRGDMDTLRSMMTGDATHHVPGSHQLSGDCKGIDAVLDYYRRLYEDHVLQANEGCDLDFLRGRAPVISDALSFL